MAASVLNYGAFTNDELTAWLAAIKTELMLRTSTGRVKSGSSSAQQYGLDTATWDDLVRTANGISAHLGLDYVDTIRVRPNFNQSQRIPDSATFGASPLG